MGRRRARRDANLEPNLYRNGDYWQYRHPITKEKKSLGKDRAEAVALARALNTRLEKAEKIAKIQAVMGTGKTVAQVVTEYIEKEVPNLPWDDRTRKNHIYKLRRVEREFGTRPINACDRVFLGEWLDTTTNTNENFMKWRERLVDLFDYAIARKYLESNEADKVRKRSLSKKIAGNRKVRKRLSEDMFWTLHDHAEPWLKHAMELSLVTLQARQEIVSMRYTDIRDGHLFVIRDKTSGDSDMAFIKIQLTDTIERIIAKTRHDGVVSPFVIHHKPKRRREQTESKEHWTQVMPEYLSKAFKALTLTSGLFEGWQPREIPTFHEIRSLGGRLYEAAGYPKSYIRALMTHTDEKTTEIYLTQGDQALTDDHFIAVKADLALKRP